MEYGQIIKKAWAITWRYRFLWVLGLFAGISGPGGGGGGSFNGGQSFGSGSSGSSGGSGSSPFSGSDLRQLESTLLHWMPAIVGGVLLLFMLGLLMWMLSLAARGGLVWAVNELEEGRRPTLGSAWKLGFSRFWSIFGVGLLLQLPMVLAALILVAAIAVPIALAFARDGRFAAAAVVPVCGALIIGLPVVLVLSFVLGIMYVIAVRRVVLDGIGAVQSAKDAWRTLRTRFKDTAIMWLINWGLNIAAGLVVAIPVVILTLTLAVPVVFAAIAKDWAVVAMLVGLWVFVLTVLSFLYSAIWGTFTSALWTILYRRLTGRERVAPPTGYAAPPPMAGPVVAPSYPPPSGSSPSITPPPYAPPQPPQPPAPPQSPPYE